MRYTKSTYRILAYKALDRDIGETWVDWALEMMENGYACEHLRMLAGITKPFNQFYLQDISTKTLQELSLDWQDKERAIKNYAYSLINEALLANILSLDLLCELKELCEEMDLAVFLFDFYALFYAKKDLLETDVQFYWPGADRDNIDSIVTNHFRNWQTKCNAEGVYK